MGHKIWNRVGLIVLTWKGRRTKTPKTPSHWNSKSLSLSLTFRFWIEPRWLLWPLETLIRSDFYHSPHNSTAAAEDRHPPLPNLFSRQMTEPLLLHGGDPWPPSPERKFTLFSPSFYYFLEFFRFSSEDSLFL